MAHRRPRQTLGDDEAIDIGQADIEQHDVRVRAAAAAIALPSIASPTTAQPSLSSSRFAVAEATMVVDHQDRRPRHGTRTHGCRSSISNQPASSGSSESS